MSVFGPLDAERRAILANQTERDQQATFLRSLAEHPAETWALVNLVSQWGDHAPTLPAGAILGLAHAGLGPHGPVGESVIRNGVPALAQPANALDRAIAAITPDELAAPPAAAISQGHAFTPDQPDLIGDPNYGSGIGGAIQRGLGAIPGAVGEGLGQTSASLQSIGGTVGSGLQAAGSFVNREAVQPINRLAFQGESAASRATPNPQSPQQVQEAGIGNADSAKSIVREAGAVGNTGLQALTVPLKVAAAATNQYVRGNPAGSTYSGPFGTKLTVGSISDALNPAQFPLYQQIHNHQGLGTGYLPAGPATEAANVAQKQAGMINGHALTYGRVLASVVAQPGTRPYSILSGAVDAGVAMELDPAAMVLKTVSDGVEASRLFAPTSEEARAAAADLLINRADTSEQVVGLRDWAGGGTRGGAALNLAHADLRSAVIDRIHADPGGLTNIAQSLQLATPKEILKAVAANQSGLFVGLRPFVKQDSALSWLSSDRGQAVMDRLAADNSFSSVRATLGDNVPVDVVDQIAKANTGEEVRQILTPELGTTVAGPIDYKWVRPPSDVRLFSQMPKGSIDTQNTQQAVQQMERTFTLAKIPKNQWDPVLSKIAGAQTPADVFDAVVNGGGGLLKAKLVQDGAPIELATKLTRYFPRTWEEQRLMNIDAAGNAPRVAGLAVDGEPVPLTGPHLENELNRIIPPLDYRALRQANTKWRQLLNIWNDGGVTTTNGFEHMPLSRAISAGLNAEQHVSGVITGAFKVGALATARLPLRFLADEHARMAAAGLDSFFNHPLSYLAMVIGNKGALDATGGELKTQLGDLQSEFSAAVGRSASLNPSPWSAQQQFFKAYTQYGKDDPLYLKSWIDELSQLHLDSPARELARAMLDPAYAPPGIDPSKLVGVDAVKQWFSVGMGDKYRNNLEAADLNWGSKYLSNRAVADKYLDTVIDRIKVKTGENPQLLDAVATGRPFDYTKLNRDITKSTDHGFRQYLKSQIDTIGPQFVKGRAEAEAAGGVGQFAKAGGALDWSVNRMFGALMDKPTGTLTRSPAFSQFYWKDIQRLMPTLDPAVQDQIIGTAAKTGITLTKTAESGALELNSADTIAKARALAAVKDLLYYPGEKTTLEDTLRNIMPFASAWRSVVKTWGTLAVEHPQILRRAQQGVQELQRSGFFHKDPQTGKEVFQIAGPEWMRELSGATGFSMEGPAQGLNIVGQGIPGVGLGPQIAAELALPHVPMTQWLRDKISPYGEPDFSGGIEMLFPGWFQKMQAGGWHTGLPIIGDLGPLGGALRSAFPQTASQKITVQDLAKQAFTTMANSGGYDFHDPAVQQRMWGLAMAQAQHLYFWRGLAQFVIPTAPTYSAKVKAGPGMGTSIFLYKIAADYRTMLDKDHGDGQAATLQLVNKYGPAMVYATEADNLRTVYGIPTTIAGEQWKSDHSSFAQKYSNVWGYFSPQDPTGKHFDYNIYRQEIKTGGIQALSVQQWAELANTKIANAIYSNLRAQLGPHTTAAIRAQLATVKAQLTKDWPGYNTNIVGVAPKAKMQQSVDELTQAIKDPAVRQTPLAQIAGAYLSLRQQVLDQAGRKTLTGAAMANARDELFQVGTQMVTKVPEFTAMWDYLFANEVDPVSTPTPQVPGA